VCRFRCVAEEGQALMRCRVVINLRTNKESLLQIPKLSYRINPC